MMWGKYGPIFPPQIKDSASSQRTSHPQSFSLARPRASFPRRRPPLPLLASLLHRSLKCTCSKKENKHRFKKKKKKREDA